MSKNYVIEVTDSHSNYRIYLATEDDITQGAYGSRDFDHDTTEYFEFAVRFTETEAKELAHFLNDRKYSIAEMMWNMKRPDRIEQFQAKELSETVVELSLIHI